MTRRTAHTSLARELWRTRVQLAAERRARLEAETRAAAKHYQATHDPLTGLLNRDGLAELWPTVTCLRPAVAIVDLDDFKPVNDVHGHAAGDEVLKTVAARMCGRSACTPVRLGGDEFALILTGDPVEVAAAVAAVIAQPIDIGDGVWVTVTASVGIAPYGAGGGLSTLLGRADAAMYRDKHTKGSVERVAVYEPRRDDHHTVAPGDVADIRTRDLKPLDQRDVPAHPYPVSEVAR